MFVDAFAYYISNSNQQLTLQVRSELSYTTTTLPNGLQSNNNQITGVLNVYDSLLAFTTDTIGVTVNPIVLSVSSLSNLLTQQLNSSSGNSVMQSQILSAVSSVLNVVNCSLATTAKCAGLNRMNCAQTSNTCGACLSGYSGVSGDANSNCVSTSSSKVIIADGGICSVNGDCGLFSYCNNSLVPSICMRLSASCPGGGDCSGHGSCSYRNVQTGKSVLSCNQGDSSCEAVCTCSGDYTTDDCSITNEDLLSKQSMRNTLITNLANITTASNPTADNLLSWSNSIASMTQVPNEITSSAANSALVVASTILSNAGSGSLSSSDLGGTVSALDTIATKVPTTSLLTLVNSYGGIVTNAMYPGQGSNDLIKSNYRLSSVVVGNDAQSELSTPVTYVESLNNIKPMKLSLPNNTDSSKNIAVTTVLMSASLYNVSGLNSNPLHMSMNQHPCVEDTSNSCSMTFTLSNNGPAAVDIINSPTQLQTFKTTCIAGVIKVVTHLCDNGVSLTEHCDGSFSGSFTSVCNTNYSMSVCNSLSSSSEVSNAGCHVLNYTSTQTVCSCPLTGFSSHRRRLGDNSSSVGGVSVDLVSMLSTVASNFESTWESADKLTAKSVLQGIQVLVVTGLIGLLAVTGVIYGYYSDKAHDTEVKGVKKSKSKKDQAVQFHRRKQLILEALAKNRNKKSIEEQLIEEALPEALLEDSFQNKFTSAVKSKHKWLSVVYHYSEHFPRMLRVLSLSTAVFSMLFVQAMLYPIAHPDNGICNIQTTEASCYAQPASIGASNSKCYWVPSTVDDDGGTCHFSPPGEGN